MQSRCFSLGWHKRLAQVGNATGHALTACDVSVAASQRLALGNSREGRLLLRKRLQLAVISLMRVTGAAGNMEHQRLTTDDEQWTTDDERQTTDDGRQCLEELHLC